MFIVSDCIDILSLSSSVSLSRLHGFTPRLDSFEENGSRLVVRILTDQLSLECMHKDRAAQLGNLCEGDTQRTFDTVETREVGFDCLDDTVLLG